MTQRSVDAEPHARGRRRRGALFTAPFGLFARQKIKAMERPQAASAAERDDRRGAVPAGEPRPAARQGGLSRARELPARDAAAPFASDCKASTPSASSLTGDGAVLEKGIVYVAPLIERLELRPNHFRRRQPEELDRPARHLHPPDRRRLGGVRRRAARLSRRAVARNFAAQFQRARARGIATQPDPLPQPTIRSRWRHARLRLDATTKSASATPAAPLVDGELDAARGRGRARRSRRRRRRIVGYRAIKNSDVIDVRPRRRLRRRGFLGADPRPRRPAADPRPRRVLYSRLAREGADPRPISPPKWRRSIRRSASSASITPAFSIPASARAPTARRARARCSKCAAATCRSCSRTASRSAAWSTKSSPSAADELYGAGATSNYQGQGLKLSKHFRDFGAA